MQHEISFEAGYDCIKFECCNGSKRCKPGEGGSHGKHGLNIRFIAKGTKGVVAFVLFTDWTPQYQSRSAIGTRHVENWGGKYTMPADLSYHSPTPQYEDQTRQEDCTYLDGKPCYYDGSGLNANDAMYALVNGGDKALWEFLDAYYLCVFEGKPYPEPAEYHKPLRTRSNESK